jgi:hypothetical protein
VAEPKPYQRRLPGGEHPELGVLFQETVSDFQDHFADYLLAGVAQFVVVMIAVLVSVVAAYLLMTLGIVGLTLGLIAITAAVEQAFGQDAVPLVLVPGQLSMILVLLVGAGAFGGAVGAALAPMHASLVRAVAVHQRGEGKLEAAAAFSTLGERLVGAVVVGAATATLAVGGVFLCYLPALLVPLLFGFGSTLVALHPLGGLRALAISARHALANPSWALPFGLMSTVLLMVSGNVPVIGPMFALSLLVRAHRYVFGDGEDPVLTARSQDGSASGVTNTQ